MYFVMYSTHKFKENCFIFFLHHILIQLLNNCFHLGTTYILKNSLKNYFVKHFDINRESTWLEGRPIITNWNRTDFVIPIAMPRTATKVPWLHVIIHVTISLEEWAILQNGSCKWCGAPQRSKMVDVSIHVITTFLFKLDQSNEKRNLTNSI